MQIREWPEAIKDFSSAAKAAPPKEAWKAEEMLARVSLAVTNKAAALEHVQSALDKTDPQHKQALLDLARQVEALKP